MTTQLSAIVSFPDDTDGSEVAAFVGAVQQLFASVDPSQIANPFLQVTTDVPLGIGASPITSVPVALPANPAQPAKLV